MPMVYSVYTSLYVHKHVRANVQISVFIYLSICIYTGIIHLCTSIYVSKTIVYLRPFRMKAWGKKRRNWNDWTLQHISEPVIQVPVQ